MGYSMKYIKFSIIGAGRVGSALALSLFNKGIKLAGMYTRSYESYSLLASEMGMSLTNDLLLAVKNAEVVFITVPDAEIEFVAKQIVNICHPDDIKGKYFFHMSGALDSNVLNLLRWNQGYTASLHPIQTFADKKSGWMGIKDIYFTFEGMDESYNAASSFVSFLGGNIIKINKKKKSLYHSALCILSNYSVALTYIAQELLEKSGVEQDNIGEIFYPLIKQTMDNVKSLGSINALTGPIARGDYEVVEGHIKSISTVSDSFARVYKELGEVVLDMAVKRGSIGRYEASYLKNILSKEPNYKNIIDGGMEI
jgi:predicted short-subunit dehydrogenase-like oxidoreductase (DUF2520 family)